ncbi:MAG: endonuclease III domain-containing protein [candidate division WOR-3 bacterium]|nr:endonuclease III domain-containing protein [candidate division WOR-3 bacterium]
MNKKRSGDDRLMKIYNILFERFGPQNWWPGESPFEVMVGAILTQNTNWQNVEKAIDNIKKAGMLSPHKLLENKERIPQLIRPSGFYKLKSKRLIAFLEYFVHNYDGDAENFSGKNTDSLRRELLSIAGIGPETADSILLYALNRPVFVVDAYTCRILSRHKLISRNKDYEEIRKFFEENLPRSVRLYNEYHALLVKLGKEYCKKNEPLCNTCPLYNTL